MTTTRIFSSGSLAAFAIICLPAGKLSAQVADEPTQVVFQFAQPIEMTVTKPQGSVGLTTHQVGMIRLLAKQVVPFTLQFPSSKAGFPVAVGCFDGGQVTAAGMSNQGTLVVPADGIVHFSFQAGQAPGLYRVLAQIPGDEYYLNFHVVHDNPSGQP